MIRQFIKAWERVKEVHTVGGKIFIRGAGNNGRMLLHDLTELGVKVTAFIDCNPALVGGEVKSIPVISPDEVYKYQRGSFFILSSVGSGDVYAELRCDMEDHGLAEGRDFADFGLNCDYRMYSDGVAFRDVEPASYDWREWNIIKLKEIKKHYLLCDDLEPTRDNYIASLDLVVTTHCSLRCMGCVSLFPECRHPRHFDPETIVSDLDKLLSIFQVSAIMVIGGETLLHPRLADILFMIEQMEHRDNMGNVVCLTNGTVPLQEPLLDALLRVRANVFLSDYGAFSPRASCIAEVCEKTGIPVRRWKANKWVNFGDFKTKRNRSPDDLSRLYNVCDSSRCYQLYDGRFYGCCRAPILYGEGLIPAAPYSYVDVRETSPDALEEALRRYLFGTPYLSACDYCDGRYPGAKEMPRARQRA